MMVRVALTVVATIAATLTTGTGPVTLLEDPPLRELPVTDDLPPQF
jgi:hypothetical protein